MHRSRRWFLAGLFLTTLTTLCLEILDTRLISVMTWYHLSFFAVSIAMFGMSAGALRVYLGGAAFEGERAERALAQHGMHFAWSIPLSHLAMLVVPIPQGFSIQMVSALALMSVLVAVPFYFSGVVVAIALTRIPMRIGLVYAVDLVGAALGCVLLLPLLEWTNGSSTALILGGLAALGALCFHEQLEEGGFLRRLVPLGSAALLLAAGILNPATGPTRVSIWYSKGSVLNHDKITHEAWNLHAQLVAFEPHEGPPWYWGPGKGAERNKVQRLAMKLDGDAGTLMTAWDGTREGLDWVRYDVTSLPYFLRKGGHAAVIGVGGGRDVLTALWGEHQRVTGIEINENFIRLLEGDYRDFAGLASAPAVRLVHDEARSYLTRTSERYDVLQMSLIDTWAATGAGAFTLSENGLYTLEAWRVFLGALAPGGLLSVSRWYDAENASETSRLVGLGVAALLERGVADPGAQLALVAQGRVATLLASNQPLSAEDVERIQAACAEYGHTPLMLPGSTPPNERLARIGAARSQAELAAALADPHFDYSVPTDERPYFFNILKPKRAFDVFGLLRLDDSLGTGANVETRGIASGNLVATNTLMVLAGISAALVLLVILLPLARAGLPRMGGASFVVSLAYFAVIGLGFMLVQVPYMQRFSVYLGHPTYAVVVTLFSMILLTGVGSLVSDRLDVARFPFLLVLYPALIAGALWYETSILQRVIESTIHEELLVRSLIVIGMVGSVSILLGLCFPIGMRLVERISTDAMPWMWGINGACGVMGAVIAVAISMWGGIHTSLVAALFLYAALALVAPLLWWFGRPARAAAAQREHAAARPIASAEPHELVTR